MYSVQNLKLPTVLFFFIAIEFGKTSNHAHGARSDTSILSTSDHNEPNLLRRKLAETKPSSEDVQTLLAIKAEMENGAQVLSDWSNSSASRACNWTGVTCELLNGYRVSGLSLGNRSLSGSLPPSLCKLQFLQNLNLSRNNFSGEVPSSLGNCTHLVYLNLYGNKFEGKIPYFGDPSVTLRELEYLNLGRNRLTGPIPDWLGDISSLGRLSLASNKVTGGIPSSLGKLSNLQVLFLSLNELSGSITPSIANCSALITLALDFNDFTGAIPSELGELRNLQQLALGTNKLTGPIPLSIFTNCTELKILLLENNGLTGEIPSEVGQLRNLDTLYMRGNRLTGSIPASFSNCSSLVWLSLDDNQLTGDLPLEFGSLQRLTSLNLWNNNLTNILPSSLANCTSLTRLSFGRDDGELTDRQLQSLIPQPFPDWIGSLVNMTYLQLMTVGLNGPFPAPLLNCTQMLVLHLSFNNLTGPVPEGIGNFSGLQELVLRSNKFTGEIPSSIGKLSNLWKLYLDDNRLEGSFPSTFSDLLVLEELQLESNQLTGEIPSAPGYWSHPYLRRMTLQDNYFSGTIDGLFGNLSYLQYLDVARNNLTGHIPSMLCTVSSLLGDLCFSDNQLTGSIPGDLFTGCTGLESIRLDGNKLGGEVPGSIGGLARLTLLDLSRNQFRGSLPSLSNLSSLNQLNLSWNQFSGILTRGGFLDLPGHNLVSIDLSQNNFSGPLPPELSSFKGLEFLDLSFNTFSGSIPLVLGQLVGLSYFNVSFNHLEGRIPTTGVFSSSGISGTSFLGNPQLCGSQVSRICPEPATASASSCKGLDCKGLLIGVIAVGCVVLLLIALNLFWCHKRFKPRAISDVSVILDVPNSTRVLKISAHTLMRATNNLAPEYLIGEGAGTKVYRLELPETGGIYAAKVLHLGRASSRHEKDLMEEIHTLDKLRHRNVLKVLGFCCNAEMKVAILEYMSNGSLYSHLYSDEYSLPWETRLNIALGIAHGLVYLHEEFPEPLIHRDLKPMNILLDTDLEPKISDFGLTKFVHYQVAGEASATAICGTVGYIPPEYTTSTRVSTKGDVYAYGIILLELLTRRQPTGNSFGQNEDIVTWAQSAAALVDVLDTTLIPANQESKQMQQMHMLMEIALKCCQNLPQFRPTMREVVQKLQKIISADIGTSDSRLGDGIVTVRNESISRSSSSTE